MSHSVRRRQFARQFASKQEVPSIAEKNRVIARITRELIKGKSFLVLGHNNPDADCIASQVAFALILRKLGKEAAVFISEPFAPQLEYLRAICRYNGIETLKTGDAIADRGFSALIILDTPKPDMLLASDSVQELMANPHLKKIELDHHLGSDSRYIGSQGYTLVSQAASCCELVGYFSFKLARWAQKQGRGEVASFFSRNFALAILTGIVGDSHLGAFLKTKREKWYYRIFSSYFNRLLGQTTKTGSANLSSKEDIYNAIQSLSGPEQECYKEMASHIHKSASLFTAALDKEASRGLFSRYSNEVMVNVSKTLSDKFAEESGKLGMVVYCDDPALSNLYQFRLRRAASFDALDLRAVLASLAITNGGGHPGAVGFRIPKSEISSITAYLAGFTEQIEAMIAASK
ncbi:DHH family phosphoesterase [Leadbettera azotonutricia]|uniref:Putative DHH superfamily protein n=1 Tax=Leadbettera azotonutricia (strain ATCC BAA-888 / DSM 13862 / ZAS-9) TaxID=545695 RepID=F5Y933_LEAAZ|nr:DHH family phosphoesterase [Leadbettera azotonutricia]AEF80104.1 putative DHH superfamily protein [Leadbettera azotonutricia ZAS-9]